MNRLAEAVNPLTGVLPNGSEPRHLFAVISWGCAATTWVAKALNSHPEILALHHGNLGVEIRNGSEPLDGVDYMWKLAYDGTGYAVAGDVHGVSRFELPKIRETFGDEFSCAVLVRDPMPRLRSLLAHFERSQGQEVFDLSYIDAIVDAKRLALPDRTYETKLFIHGVNLLNAVVQEQHEGPIYLSEQLTTDPGVFSTFARHLTAGHVSIDSKWVARAMSASPMNVHAHGELQLADWQRDAISRVVEPEAREVYASLGYRSLDA